VVVETAFAKRLPWAGWTSWFAKQRKVDGLHVVVLLWCSTDGTWRIPVAVGLWRAKRTCTPHRYQTKLQLAAGCSPSGRRPPALPGPGAGHPRHRRLHHPPGRPAAPHLGGDARPRTTVVWCGRRQPVAALARRLRLGWRPRLGLRAAAVTVSAQRTGWSGWS
jgi:hypothetical protein